MFNTNLFISKHITHREKSMFLEDLKKYKDSLIREIEGKRVLVIGGGGSIGSSYIKALLPYRPASLVVIDLSENYLAELTRDVRSSQGLYVPQEFRTYTLNYADPIFEKLFREERGFDIIANFSAHKHVRSEKDITSIQALIENNDIKAKRLLDIISEYPPSHFFCVSTDKAANPVNIMGASKSIMEDLVMAYRDRFPVTTARFANVAFSNGSLPSSFIKRVMKKQPLVAPTDVRRYFVSPEESGQICLMASVLGKSGEIFFPILDEGQMMTFSDICDWFLLEMGYEKKEFHSDEEAKAYAAAMPDDSSIWPVHYSKSDTSGEKTYEEFYVEGEDVDLKRFSSLGVIKAKAQTKSLKEIEMFFHDLEELFSRRNVQKDEIVQMINTFIPNFAHIETGKNLDQKM